MPTPPLGQRREALRLLGLEDPVGHSEVVGAYRRLVRQHHPDLGGDPDAFRSLIAARDVLLAGGRSDPGGSAGSPAGRSVRVRKRTGRRILRGLRQRLGRKRPGSRQLD